MTVINCTIPFGAVKDISDYAKIINDILKFDISFNILKFSTVSSGVNVLLDVPEEKLKFITEALTHNNVLVNKKGRVIQRIFQGDEKTLLARNRYSRRGS